jgi:nicotinate phosphoribosyltransferase
VIIDSLLDNDLYKFTMMQTVLHNFPGAIVEYRFQCRTPGANLSLYVEQIRAAIADLCQLKFSAAELQYLRSFSFFKHDFIDFLRIFSLNNEFITVADEGMFDIVIKGPWLHTILFEVPVLAIVSEIYFRHLQPVMDWTEGENKLAAKIDLVKKSADKGFRFSEFGTRRRFSKQWQREVIGKLLRALPHNLTGTSNVYFAREYDIKPMGTMGHEYIQACQTLGPRLIDSQKFAFEVWAREYRGDLGTALSDTYGMDAFLRDFDLYFCKLFDGVRNDSGDPFEWGEKLLAHYEKLRINPATKTLVFSDKLNFPLAIRLYHHFKGRTNPAFGLGTNLTNDLGFEPLQIVIKMVECNGQPVAKVTDSPGKTFCRDEGYLAYLKQVFKINW